MAARGYYGQMRATDSDRDNVHQVLQSAYADGRLTWDEFDTRSGQLVVAKTYDQLAALTADLRRPVPYQPPTFVPSRSGTSGLAVTSLIFGIGQIFAPILGAIIAIIFGHAARSEIRRHGQEGNGMALAGMVLGYLGLAIPTLVILLTLLDPGK